jgi:hypothetical protein
VSTCELVAWLDTTFDRKVNFDYLQYAWRKIIARLRVVKPGLVNGVDVATTPEGFRFTYDQFVKQIRDRPELASLYGIVQASTYENGRNLPDDYISSLKASYPQQLIDAYLDGKFVNLTSGAVYPNFDRRLNHTRETIQPGEPLHVGMDFNVLNMTAAVSVIRDDKPLTLAEVCKVRDTPTMARVLQERFKGHHLTVYPDASGGNTSSKDAAESDLSILRSAGLSVRTETLDSVIRKVARANKLFREFGQKAGAAVILGVPLFVHGIPTLEEKGWTEIHKFARVFPVQAVETQAGYELRTGFSTFQVTKEDINARQASNIIIAR